MQDAKSRHSAASAFSEFFREAKSREKKRVYMDVLEKATKEQQQILKDAARRK